MKKHEYIFTSQFSKEQISEIMQMETDFKSKITKDGFSTEMYFVPRIIRYYYDDLSFWREGLSPIIEATISENGNESIVCLSVKMDNFQIIAYTIFSIMYFCAPLLLFVESASLETLFNVIAIFLIWLVIWILLTLLYKALFCFKVRKSITKLKKILRLREE